MLLTIDPGNDTGWALWGGSALVACGHGDHWKGFRPSRVLIESPVIYPRSPVPPNDIVKLARLAGEYGGILKARGADVEYVEPAQWKGQTPKKIHNARTKAKVLRLTPQDQELVRLACSAVPLSAEHNILDAIGIGLWVLGL